MHMSEVGLEAMTQKAYLFQLACNMHPKTCCGFNFPYLCGGHQPASSVLIFSFWVVGQTQMAAIYLS